jgi:hypothetical protein
VAALPGEEAFRSDISVEKFLKRERAAVINRLRTRYGKAEIVDVNRMAQIKRMNRVTME